MDVVVLVVDPDAAMRGFCQRLLERRGMAVLVASHASEALRVLANAGGEVDVVVAPRHLVMSGDIALGLRIRGLAPRASIVCTGVAAPNEARVRDRLPAAVPAPAARSLRAARAGSAASDGLLEGDALTRAVVQAARAASAARRSRRMVRTAAQIPARLVGVRQGAPAPATPARRESLPAEGDRLRRAAAP